MQFIINYFGAVITNSIYSKLVKRELLLLARNTLHSFMDEESIKNGGTSARTSIASSASGRANRTVA
jgi:hypothetical protein